MPSSKETACIGLASVGADSLNPDCDNNSRHRDIIQELSKPLTETSWIFAALYSSESLQSTISTGLDTGKLPISPSTWPVVTITWRERWAIIQGTELEKQTMKSCWL